jgi:hypothetical protein
MSIRAFDWRDLPALHRYRRQSVFLNSALLYTRGPMMFQGAMLSSLSQATGIFTSVSTKNGDTRHVLIGQAVHSAGSQIAQLTFLCPDEAMRHASFAIYARQRVWQLEDQPSDATPDLCWQVTTDQDLIPVRSLYNNLIPGLVQQVEPFPADRLHGMVYRQEGDLLAYVELKYGHRGIWVQPFVHPDAEDVITHILELIGHVPHRRSRPIYLCIRSYNSWLEPALEDMGARSRARQAVMVRHLAVPQKAVRTYALPVLEGGHPEVTAPIAQARSAQAENNGILCHNKR